MRHECVNHDAVVGNIYPAAIGCIAQCVVAVEIRRRFVIINPFGNDVAFHDVGIKQRAVCHSFIKFGHVDYNFPDIFVRGTLGADSAHEIVRLEITVFATANVAVIHIITLCTLLAGCHAAFGRVSQFGVFFSAILAKTKMCVCSVSVAERSELVLMPRSGKILFSARLTLCAA